MKRRKRWKQQRRILLLGGVTLLSVLVVFLIAHFVMKGAVNKVPADKVANNVYLEGVDVSGMTAKEVKKALKSKTKKYQSKTVVLEAEDDEIEVTLEELGLKVKNLDKTVEKVISYGKKGSLRECYKEIKALKKEAKHFEAQYTIDEKEIEKTISSKLPHLKNRAQDATIKRENGEFVITEGKKGKKIELADSVKAIQKYLDGNWKNQKKGTIQLVTVVAEPDITKKQLSQIQDQLGTFSTNFAAGTNRGKNVVLATSKINGAVLMPGEEYSASEGMGESTPENGYVEAGSYLNGETVQSYGGGVCQVSSTLYNAVILAELEVTERWPHSMTVSYVKESMDAAIAEGYKDLKFKNNTDTPIYIEGYTYGGRVTFNIYGKETRPAQRKVSYVSEVTSKTEAKKKFEATDEPVGTFKEKESGHDAIKAKLWKVVTENGVEVSRKVVNNSSYQSSTALWSVGIGTDHAQAKELLINAIETQDEAKIQEAITQAKELISSGQ